MKINKMSLKQKVVMVILLCLAIIYIVCASIKYRASYDYLIKTPYYRETMEFINNYDYSKIDKIYVHTLAVCEFENQSLTVTKEEEPELFEDIISIFFNDNRKYGEHKIKHNHTPTYYAIFTDEETSEEITIYVHSAYNVIIYEDCYFKCSEDIHSDFIIIKDAIINARKENNN